MNFEILARDEFSHARVGQLVTEHGIVQTPTYMAVGTYGPVRTLDVCDLLETNNQVVLGNTFHLESTIGSHLIKDIGGLAAFTGWNGPTLTDSGGYQVSYMWGSGTHSGDEGERKLKENSPIVRITKEGAVVRNIHTGQKFLLSPERSMEIQANLSADIVMAFDRPIYDSDSYEGATETLSLSHHWTDLSFKHWNKLKSNGRAPSWQEFFPIIQGGQFRDLRRRSAEHCVSLDSFGLAVAGESIGINPHISEQTLEMIDGFVPRTKVLYAMGLGGGPEGFLRAVRCGVDLFDNTSPTRLGRCGLALVTPQSGGNIDNKFRINLKKGRFRADDSPLDTSCKCKVCSTHTKSYIRHCLKIEDPLGMRLLSHHNLYFMNNLGCQIRDSISQGTFESLFRLWLNSN